MNNSGSFFTPEIRWGFTISEMMKRCWAANLDVLEVFKEVCRQNGLKYYAAYGTLLGALRHNGFVPWDDDIDLIMIREDYDRFIEIAPQVLPKGFVLSGMYGSDKRLWQANDRMHTRLIVDEEYYSLPEFMTLFHGYPYQRVGFDLFVLDHVPVDRQIQYELVKRYQFLNFVVQNLDMYDEKGFLQGQLDEIEQAFSFSIDRDDKTVIHRQLRFLADRLAAETPRENSDFLFDIRNMSVPDSFEAFGSFENEVRMEWYGDGIEVPFENTTIRVPKKAFDVMEANFGSGWMKPVKFASEHPYPCYINQEAELRRLLDESGISLPIDDFCRNWHMMNGGD